jgi:hypothetical protein
MTIGNRRVRERLLRQQFTIVVTVDGADTLARLVAVVVARLVLCHTHLLVPSHTSNESHSREMTLDLLRTFVKGSM